MTIRTKREDHFVVAHHEWLQGCGTGWSAHSWIRSLSAPTLRGIWLLLAIAAIVLPDGRVYAQSNSGAAADANPFIAASRAFRAEQPMARPERTRLARFWLREGNGIIEALPELSDEDAAYLQREYDEERATHGKVTDRSRAAQATPAFALRLVRRTAEENTIALSRIADGGSSGMTPRAEMANWGRLAANYVDSRYLNALMLLVAYRQVNRDAVIPTATISAASFIETRRTRGRLIIKNFMVSFLANRLP